MADPQDPHPVRAWPSHVWGKFAESTDAKLYAVQANGEVNTADISEISESSLDSAGEARARIILCRGTVWNPHQMTMDDLERWFRIVKFARDPLRRVDYLGTMGIEHQIGYDERSGAAAACSLLLRFEVTEQRAFCAFLHHDFATDQHDFVLFLGGQWYDSMEEDISDMYKLVGRTPFFLITYLIRLAALRMSNMRQGANTNLNEVEVTLGASNNIEHLKSIGLKATSMPLGDMNKALVSVQIDISDVIEEATAMLHLIDEMLVMFKDAYCPRPAGIPKHLPNPFAVLEAEFRSLIRHVTIIKTVNGSAQRRLESLFAVLLNRINRNDAHLTFQMAKAAKADSTAMRTISILTLVYLPGTFVCAVFSTTFFNFQNWNVDSAIASGGWWIFLTVCVLLTALTIVAWLFWIRKENRKIARELQTMDGSHLDNLGDESNGKDRDSNPDSDSDDDEDDGASATLNGNDKDNASTNDDTNTTAAEDMAGGQTDEKQLRSSVDMQSLTTGAEARDFAAPGRRITFRDEDINNNNNINTATSVRGIKRRPSEMGDLSFAQGHPQRSKTDDTTRDSLFQSAGEVESGRRRDKRRTMATAAVAGPERGASMGQRIARLLGRSTG